MKPEIVVLPDMLGITAAEFNELLKLTVRFQHDANAIFSVNCDGDVWPSSRYGKTQKSEREILSDIPYILEQLKRSLLCRRMEGGRLFVDLQGAYWKKGSTGNIKRIHFVTWRWKGEPPPEPRSITAEEALAEFRKMRNKKP